MRKKIKAPFLKRTGSFIIFLTDSLIAHKKTEAPTCASVLKRRDLCTILPQLSQLTGEERPYHWDNYNGNDKTEYYQRHTDFYIVHKLITARSKY